MPPDKRKRGKGRKPNASGFARLADLAVLLVVLIACLPMAACSGGMWPFGSQAGAGTEELGDRDARQVTFIDAPTYIEGSPAGAANPSASVEGTASEGARTGTGGAASTQTSIDAARRALDQAEAALKAGAATVPR